MMYEYDPNRKRILYHGNRLSKAEVLDHLNGLHEIATECFGAYQYIEAAGRLMFPIFASPDDGFVVTPPEDAPESSPEAVSDEGIKVGGTD